MHAREILRPYEKLVGGIELMAPRGHRSAVTQGHPAPSERPPPPRRDRPRYP